MTFVFKKINACVTQLNAVIKDPKLFSTLPQFDYGVSHTHHQNLY